MTDTNPEHEHIEDPEAEEFFSRPALSFEDVEVASEADSDAKEAPAREERS